MGFQQGDCAVAGMEGVKLRFWAMSVGQAFFGLHHSSRFGLAALQLSTWLCVGGFHGCPAAWVRCVVVWAVGTAHGLYVSDYRLWWLQSQELVTALAHLASLLTLLSTLLFVCARALRFCGHCTGTHSGVVFLPLRDCHSVGRVRRPSSMWFRQVLRKVDGMECNPAAAAQWCIFSRR